MDRPAALLRTRRVGPVGALVLLGVGLAALGAPEARAAPAPAVSPNAIHGLGSADQVIEIATRDMNTTYATARTYELVRDSWRMTRGAMAARVGYNGLSAPAQRHEGDGTTPIGRLRLRL